MKSFYLLPFALFTLSSCYAQGNVKNDTPVPVTDTLPANREQISQYIRRMFQDRDGNIWLGTNGDGVCRYDGRSLTYYNRGEGLAGEAVRGILQDVKGDLWFATNDGLSRYDGKSFTNYTVKDGLSHNQIWSMIQDRAGNIWLGTEGGVNRYDAILKIFTKFPLPVPDIKNYPNTYPAAKLVGTILQDKAGNIWFGTNGGGAYKYDGKSLTNISEKDGLTNNVVQCILEDAKGMMWFATRFGGVSRYDGKTFTNFTAMNGIVHKFAWTMLEDKSGNIWIGTAGGGLYCYRNGFFTHYGQDKGLGNTHVQSLLEDKSGSIWVGCSGGLYRYENGWLVNFTRDMAGK